MQNDTKKHTASGEMDEHKREWLQSLELADAKSVLDCNPIERSVVMKVGDKIFNRVVAERYTRVMGYHRPISSYNPGKKQEHADRVNFKEPKSI